MVTMSRPAPSELYEETISVPGSVCFPVELTPPDGFDPGRPETWPDVAGSLEWVAGRLFYMPPCGDRQRMTVTDVATVLGTWVRSHPEFCAGTNEAGMQLGDDTRGADAAVWRRSDVGTPTGGIARVPPILAVEVEGRYEGSLALREKARWYLDRGVSVVWLLHPKSRHVVVVTRTGETLHEMGDRLHPCPELPDLTPEVADLFWQLSRYE